MHYKTINLNVFLEAVDSFNLPNPVELANTLTDAIPKEWHSDDDGGYSVRFVPTISNDAIGELQHDNKQMEHHLEMKAKKIRKLTALLAQEQKLTAHLDRNNGAMGSDLVSYELQVQNLIEKNDNQAAQLDTLQVNYDGSLADWKHIQKQRDDALSAASRCKDDLLACQATNRNNLGESKVTEEMVVKIVDAMQGAGYDISEWGNEADLTELENAATVIEDELQAARKSLTDTIIMINDVADKGNDIDVSLDTVSSEVDILSVKLDEIRTER